MVNLKINGKEVQAPEGITVLQAAQQSGIKIPTLCHHPDLHPTGSCRICVVEVKGWRTPMTSCTLPVSEGIEIETHSASIVKSRKTILEMILANHSRECITCDMDGDCELQELAYEYQVQVPEWGHKGKIYKPDSDPNPFIRVDLSKCIQCTRCVRACAEIQGRFVWTMAERGFETHPVAGANSTLLEARCESCGACVAYCPTGALSDKMSHGLGRRYHVQKVMTTCSFCGVGCQFELNVRDGKIIRVTSTTHAPVNGNHLCVKGRYAYDYIQHPDRLTKPKVRRYLLEGGQKSRHTGAWDWVETDWDTALDIAARRMHSIRTEYGADKIGVLTSAKCLNEENYLMNKFARQVIGTNNIDHCARLCHSSTVAGLATSFGSGAMSNSMDDVAEQSQLLFLIGSNITEQHPVFGAKIRQAVARRGAKLIVADPRRIDITEFATLHLQHKPGTDVALINGLMYLILENGWEDKAFIEERCENFDDFKATVMQYPPEKASEITGVPVEQLRKAAQLMGETHPMAVLWAMGITQHITGVRNVMDLANLQMLLGNMGKPGGGVNPLRGQNNVQGACDMGGLPNVYPAYQSVTNPDVVKKFETAWGAAPEPKVGMTVTTMITGIVEDKIKGLYILGEDPAVSDPDSAHIRYCLEHIELLILQEIFPSETSKFADILLPGVSFAEKTGTFTNTERRVQMVRQAIQPIGEARPDWQIIAALAKRILALGGRDLLAEAPLKGWDYADTDAIMTEINQLAPSYAGITHARLENGERLQWPVPGLDHPGTPILHTKSFSRGKGMFMPIDFVPAPELPDDNYPFILSTGRVLYHWHSGNMTRRAEGIMQVYGKPLVEINPEDAERLGVNGSKTLRISSRRGVIESEAWVTERVPPGVVYANFHFPEASANELTIAELDPTALIPSYKVCAVKVELVN